ncbi:MAG: hypothetical protein AAGC67_00160 [Myxococcota bacterium]
MSERWRRCSACKSEIALGAVHWVCSVSTCNRKRTGLVFCTVDCWEIHLPTERHREAWAVEARAPETPDPPAGTPAGKKTHDAKPARTARADAPTSASASSASTSTPTSASTSTDGEILVVASKLKAYVKERSGFNTSDRVLPVLSRALRSICDEAIEHARRAERQTVMDRDVPRAERLVDRRGRPALIRRRGDR